MIFLSGCSIGQLYSTEEGSVLDIHYKINKLDNSVGADLGDNLLAPRIDANVQETYFWLRSEYSFTEDFHLFIESYQGANSVVPLHKWKQPPYIWDGIWLRPGIVLHLNDRTTFEGGPVYYTFSSSRRSDQWGALFSLRWDF
jgi:hypothetical protein